MRMTKEQANAAGKYFKSFGEHYSTDREFARALQEDTADIARWKKSFVKVSPRCVVTLALLHGANVHLLRPDIFPAGCEIHFTKKGLGYAYKKRE